MFPATRVMVHPKPAVGDLVSRPAKPSLRRPYSKRTLRRAAQLAIASLSTVCAAAPSLAASAPPTTAAAAPAGPTGPSKPSSPPRPGPDGAAEAPRDPTPRDDVLVTVLPKPDLSGGSVGGHVVASDDPRAGLAKKELEGLGLGGTTGLRLPERTPTLHRAAWGTLLAGSALLITAGRLAGLAEREEDRARSIAGRIDPETGRQPLFADEQEAYEAHIQRGEAEASVAQALAITGAVTVATAAVLFLIHHRRRESTGDRGHATALRDGFGCGLRF
ncbi:MAG: hypothetical protein V3V08_09635 [Nannocystaceae bacterium]